MSIGAFESPSDYGNEEYYYYYEYDDDEQEISDIEAPLLADTTPTTDSTTSEDSDSTENCLEGTTTEKTEVEEQWNEMGKVTEEASVETEDDIVQSSEETSIPKVEPSGADLSGTATSTTSEKPDSPESGLEGTTPEQTLVTSNEDVQVTEEAPFESDEYIGQSSEETSIPTVEPSGADLSGTATSSTSEESGSPESGLEGTTTEQTLVTSNEFEKVTEETEDDIGQSSEETSMPTGADLSGTEISSTALVESKAQPEAESTTNAPGSGSMRTFGFFAIPFMWLLALK